MSDIQVILTSNQAFYRAFEQQDVNTMGSLWSQEADCICIHPGRPVLKGWEQIRSSWEQIFQNTGAMQLNVDIVTANASGNVGYVIVHERLLQNIEGRQVESRSLATNIFENISGMWYLVHRHASPIIPPMPPNNQAQPGSQKLQTPIFSNQPPQMPPQRPR